MENKKKLIKFSFRMIRKLLIAGVFIIVACLFLPQDSESFSLVISAGIILAIFD